MPQSSPSITWLMRISPCLRPTGGEGPVQSHTSYGKCDPHFSTPLRIIYDHELIMYRNCTCRLEFDDREIICTPDTFIIIPPGKWHSEVCPQAHRGYRYWCHFDWTFQSVKADSPVMSFATNRPRYDLCHPPPDFIPQELLHGKISNPDKAYALGEKLKTLASVGTAHEMLLAGTVLHELLIELLDTPRVIHDQLQGDYRDISIASRIRCALDKIASKPYKNLKLSDALSELNYSYEHLCRVFKKMYGVSPLHYVHAQQMTRAKVLLKKSDLNISEICVGIGMNSPAYFTKTFRSFVGKTPSEYRKGC